MLDADRLFFIVGDVSGKGLPASIFMAVSKALCKSAALRSGRPVNEFLGEAAEDIARENPESLFVTAFAGVLDVRSGALEYCNAGHEYPLVFGPGDEIKRLDRGGGPPLCVLEGFPYELAEYRLSRGGTLCLVSDGVTEAMNRAGELYGVGRLRAAIDRTRHTCNPRDLSAAIRADVTQFVAGAEAADDLTLLVLRWNGP
jgi:serine phosphatase RsbU (regulator of sigma subunit)